MRATINLVPSLFSPEKAEAIAAMMNADVDDDWTYTARHDPKGTGYSLVDIFDEDGFLVGQVAE